MTNRQSYDQELIDLVLARLKVAASSPDRRLLEGLVDAFVRTVPWESAFRIVRRVQCKELETCPRWPEEYWNDHLQRGAGGSCFESNYAFFTLLNALGYECYLTINNMGAAIGCHTAIVVMLDGKKWLVDVGFPIYIALPINPNGKVYRSSPFLRYTIRPEGVDRYQIERRPHPKWYAFTLIDRPVSEEQYRQATTADYGPNGHFLDRVIIHKAIDGLLWRFNSDRRPYCLECFKNGHRGEQILDGDVVKIIARKFGMDEEILHSALKLSGS